MARRSSPPPLVTATVLLLLIGGAEAWRIGEAIELHTSETAGSSRLAGRGAKSSVLTAGSSRLAGRGVKSSVLALSARAGTVDPIFLGTAVGLSTLANLANSVLHAVRISHLGGTRAELETIQEQIFSERADACFSVRSLEVQADLLTRAVEAFVEFTGAQVPETAFPLTISDGKLGRGGTANATAAKAIASDVARISKSLRVVNRHLRRAMAAAVQSACHSAASGEIIIQANVDKLGKQIKEAQAELVTASFQLVSDLAGGLMLGMHEDTETTIPADLEDKIAQGKVLMKALVVLQQVSANKWEVPEGISNSTWRTMMGGLGIMWTTTTAIAVSLQNTAAVDIVVRFDAALQGLYKLVTDQHSEGLEVATEVLHIVHSVLELVSDCVSLASPGGKEDPALLYASLTVTTLTKIVRLAQTSLQLQQEQGQQSEMIAQAQSTKRDAALLRSYGTCNALGTAWTLSGTAGTFMNEATVAGGVSLQDVDEDILKHVYERYAEERPYLAAKVLREALSLGIPGVTEELIHRAESLAGVAPITDFAVASDKEQLKALGALGFQPVPSLSHEARFLICRGCGDSFIAGMKVVADDEMFRGLEENFTTAPRRFGDLRMPSDSTLNFVQLPREEGFSMLAFAKVPRAALATRALPVLFDLREEVFATEARRAKAAGATFREKAMAILSRNEVQVLSWKTDQTDKFGGISDLFRPLGKCDPHTANQNFASLDILAGRFLLASPDELEEDVPLRSLVPDALLRQGRYITMTKGCGCRMGRLGNPYRAGDPDKVTKWWMAIEDSYGMLQVERCQWRYDIWLSDEPLVDVGTVDGDNDPDLGCTISYASTELPEPVDDLSQLRFVTAPGLGRPPIPGCKKLYSSNEAEEGPAGRPQWLDENGCTFNLLFQIWKMPPEKRLLATPQIDETHLKAMVTDFQENIGSVLCSARCAFSDLHSVPQALDRVLSLSPVRHQLERFVPHQRGTSEPCDHVQKMLMPQGFPTDKAGFVRSGFGQLTTNEMIAGSDEGLFGKIEPIYKEGCDFEATVLLYPAQCGEGHVPDLRLTSQGLVEETCMPKAVGGTTAAPLHRYAVAWDLHYHDEGSLREEEKEVESGLTEAGFNRWGEAMMFSSPKLNTDTWYWKRSLRQRIFVQRDPRVITASGAEVCSL